LPFLSLFILIFNPCEKNSVNINEISFETFKTYHIDSTYKMDSIGSFLIITNKNILDTIFQLNKLLDSSDLDSIY